MPQVYGEIYPEIECVGRYNVHLCILVCTDGDQDRIRDTLHKLAVLRSYLCDLSNNSVSLSIYLTDSDIPDWLTFFKPTPGRYAPESTIKGKEIGAIAETIDADFVAVDESAIEGVKGKADSLRCPIVTLADVLQEAEIFVKGHDIPWSIDHPVWFMPWSSFYSMLDDFGQQSYDLYQKKARALVIDKEVLENIRSLLLNRWANLCFTRDRLLFICQQRDHAKRQGWKRQRFIFEASYFLSHYYHLLWGGTEQLARVLHSVLDLNISNKVRISLGNSGFIGKVIAKDKDIGEIFTRKLFTKWIDNLKTCRNHIAHQGTVVLSPLVEKLDPQPSDKDLETMARLSPEYASFERLVPPGQLQEHVEMLKADILASLHRPIRDDALIITAEGKQTLLYPLNDINWHFENYKETLNSSLSLLFDYLAGTSDM